MDKQLFGDYPENERFRLLSDNADRKEEMTYPVELTGEELNEVKDQFIKTTVEMKKLEDQLSDFKEWYKGQMKPLKLDYSLLQEQLRYKVVEVTEDVMYIADQDEGNMGIYSPKGKLISQRPLKSNERQMRITNKKLNNNG